MLRCVMSATADSSRIYFDLVENTQLEWRDLVKDEGTRDLLHLDDSWNILDSLVNVWQNIIKRK